MSKFIYPFKCKVSVRFFPSRFIYKPKYITFTVDSFTLMKRLLRIPLVGEVWRVVEDDILKIENRKKATKLSDLIELDFIKMLYKSGLKLNVKIIEAASANVVADKTVETIAEFKTLPYEEKVGHFLFFSVYNSKGVYVGKSLHTISKMLNDGWEYKQQLSVDSHLFVNQSNKKLYYKQDKGVVINKSNEVLIAKKD